MADTDSVEMSVNMLTMPSAMTTDETRVVADWVGRRPEGSVELGDSEDVSFGLTSESEMYMAPCFVLLMWLR
jgi:hypothetical protein